MGPKHFSSHFSPLGHPGQEQLVGSCFTATKHWVTIETRCSHSAASHTTQLRRALEVSGSLTERISIWLQALGTSHRAHCFR